jgi:CheY-like chemotaxis protein
VPAIVVASDAAFLRKEVASVAAGSDVEIREVSSGPELLAAVEEDPPDLVVVDLQMGNMGGMAVCLELRLAETTGELPHVPVLMLLDRRPDVFLARRSGADGWLVKPLDPLRMRRAIKEILGGGEYLDDSYQPVPVLVDADEEPQPVPSVT